MGAEITVQGSVLSGTRRLRPEAAPGAWSDTTASQDTTTLQAELARLEGHHLLNLKGAGPQALLDMAATLPAGFVISSEPGNDVVATRTATKHKEKPKKGLWAVWDVRETLTATLEPSTRSLLVSTYAEHRFTTEESEGSWIRATTTNPALPIEWRAAAARRGIPLGSVTFGPSLLEVVAPRSLVLAQPPPPPKLRTIKEIELVVTRRAYQSRTGLFKVCLDHVLVNPTDDTGYNWDLPGVEGALSYVSAAADVVSQINSYGDAYPPVGMLLDATLESMAVYSGVPLERAQLGMIAMLTKEISELAQTSLPVQPDVGGVAIVSGAQFNLTPSEDDYQIDPHICGDATFQNGSPAAISLDLWDVDMSYNDPIATCRLSLGDILDRGVSGLSCGFARAYASAAFLYSFDQISIVGLPPAE